MPVLIFLLFGSHWQSLQSIAGSVWFTSPNLQEVYLTATEFWQHIREHWGIENRLHWVKDVHFHEDWQPRPGGNAPVNWAILHTFFISMARLLSYRTIPQAQQCLANQLHQIFQLLV